MSVCKGSGRQWQPGTGSPMCPICHRGPRSLGVKPPIRRKGRFTGHVPEHETRQEWEAQQS